MVSIPAFIVIPFYITNDMGETVAALFGQSFLLTAVGVVTIFLMLWPSLCFLLGLRANILDVKEHSNHGIRAALVNACRAGVGMFVSGMLGLGIGFPSEFFRVFGAGVWISLIPAAGFALAFGGVDVINHYVLRFIVYRNGYAPKKLHRFLDHCTKLVFLRRVGGGYIFIHRLLLEHFAAMWEAEHKQKGTKAAVTSGSASAAPT